MQARHAHGVFVHYYDPKNPEDNGMFWSYALRGQFRTWAEWWVYIGAMMSMYGLELEGASE